MKFFMVDNAGKSMPCEVPDDYRMDELFCDINGIGEDVTGEEVHRLMAASDDAIGTNNGKQIRFADHANDTTTLASLGIKSDEKYSLYHHVSDNMFSGGSV